MDRRPDEPKQPLTDSQQGTTRLHASRTPDPPLSCVLSVTRRHALLLPFALAACGGSRSMVSRRCATTYLPPIQLNVASIAVEQRFIPAGVPPDVSNRDPAPPIEALKAMANDRLQAFGTSNKAVFAILDASLTRENDVVTGSFAVSLTILDDNGTQLGFAEARVQSRHTGGSTTSGRCSTT